jgi:glycine amidinotransferase/scyllo-inosamine-4-phosphate amidinotransferase 1
MDIVNRGGMYNYCPRDRLVVFGDRIIDTAMMYPCRDMEIEALDFVIERARDVYTMPRDQGLVLDAANICRLNDDWLFLESASGNRAAYDWLCQNVPNVRIELCNFYAGVHIDSTIVPLREGLVLLNASRVTPDTCPRVFDGWDKIWVEDVVPQGFHEYPYASKWIALNMLSLSPDTVIMDADQADLRRTLESRGITVIPHRIRHSRTLGGGFHCVTLDIVREP